MKTTKFRWFVAMLLLVAAMVMPVTGNAQVTYNEDGFAEDGSYQPATDSDNDGVYEIGNAGQLYWFAALVNGTDGLTQNLGANAILTADITVNTGVLNADGTLASNTSCFRVWTPIVGNAYPDYYAGTFDGQNHTVSGLYFNDSSVMRIGLFGVLGSSGKVYNVGVVDSYFCGYQLVGGVCGAKYGAVENCYSASTVSGTNSIGGVCGNNYYGNLLNCYNTGAVIGTGNYIGGVCGIVNNGKIESCYSTGTVSGSSEPSVGGVCGYSLSEIINCYFDSSKCDKNAVGSNKGTVEKTEGKTTTQFASGEVAYLLNNSVSDGTQKWYQTIGEDSIPTLNNTRGTVYYATLLCGGEKNVGNTYANTQEVSIEHDYNENGFCTVCGAYQPATLTTDKYDINGDNTKDEVYEIGNAGQLYWFAALVNGTLIDGTAQNLSANAVLVNDITVNTGVLKADGTLASDTSGFKAWTPIVGNSYPNNYAGTFDGQNHTVSGLYFNDSSANKIGLFGHLGSSGKISNVGVVDSYFCGNQFVGGVCGAKYGAMENCYSASTVSGTESVGGVCGNNFNGKLLNCYNTGAVIGTGWYIGGVCGIVNNGGTIQNCYSTGTVGGSSSSSVVGGVCGMNNRSGTISNCYFDSEKCDKDAIGTNNGTVTNVEGKTTEQFKSGEVCYLLNGSVSDGSQKWYQTIGTDGAPVLDNTRGTVYYATLLCGGEKNVGNTYANTQEVSIEHDYNENGFCTKCGAYQPATDSDSDGVYEIGNAGQLFWFAALVNGDNTHADFDAQNTSASAVLTNDIDLENREWKPITAFAGSFDGQGHTVSNFKITSTTNNSGFFGSANGTIMNFTLKGEITLSADGAEIGSIVGNTDGATIRNIASYVNISNTAVELKHVGGVVGSIQTTETVVDQCVYYGNMNIQNSHDCIGGVVGYTSDGGRISNCANLGTVTATKDGAYVGGVLGYVNNTKAMVKNCYNYGSVSNGSTSTYCGAVIGWVRSHTAGNLADNYYLDASCSLGFGSASNSGATATAKTAEQFASGEVCYLLNGNTSDGAWGQTIGTDPYPVLGGDKVYYGYADCDENKDQTYSNTELADTRPDHNYSNGFCTKCGAYQPATLTTDKYDIDGVEGFDEVYEIGNAGQLYWFAALVNGTDGLTQNLGANAVLTADITVNTGVLNADGTLASDVSGFTEWTPIVGNDYPDYYAGTFDGQNHTVSGLYFDNSSVMRIGLFGHLGSSGKISNVGVVDSYFKGKDYVGGVCGAKYGAVENCYNASTVSGTGAVGGVCGDIFDGDLKNCYNTGAVIGTRYYIGGVCGLLNCDKIENCYSTGIVSGSSASSVGGVCGFVSQYGTITNCYFDSSKCDKNAVGSNKGTVEKTEGKTTTQFANGEVAYLLQSGQTADENGVTPEVWGQTIGTEDYPVLGGEKVYLTTGECVYYTNTFFEGEQSHDYVNGFCTKCGAYQPATLTTDKYDINGDGQNDAVYEIGNAGQLYWFAALVNGDKRVIKEAGENASKNAVLTKDITVNSGVLKEDGSLSDNSSSFTSWTPIGYFNSYEDKCPYTGTFDGQNHKISGLYFNSSKNSVGLFGYVENGTVKNVGVEDSYFNVVSSNGEVYVGGVCGYNISGTITNCYNTGKVSVSSTSAIYAGGVCGWNGGAITNCYNTGKVTSTSDAYAGGVCGVNGGEIKSCYNTGEVTDTATSYAYAGGVCGCNVGEITNCYNEGLVNASGNTVYAGGVCGDNDIQSGSGTPTIANCYSTGSVTANVTDTTGTSNSGTAYAGGVCGSNGDEATIANCYFDSTVYNGEAVGNNNGGTVSANVIGKTTEQFNSGEVAYLLSQGCTVDDILFGGSVWGQTLSGTDKQDYPVLGGLPVYFRDEVYTNTYGILTVGTQTITASNEPPIWYEFTPTSDGNYRFSSKTINGGVCVNTKITINDMQGMSSSPIYALSADTTYYVYLNCSQGEYDLTIEKLNTTLTTGDNELIVPTTGRLWYEFTPTETGSYQFSSTQLTAGNLYVNKTQNESDYTDIATSPTYNLEAETTYYVAVSATPGNYDLTITLIPTALETVTAPQIYAVDGRIVCDGEFRIYDLLGRDVTLLNGSLCGVYVVKTADAAQKVVVR